MKVLHNYPHLSNTSFLLNKNMKGFKETYAGLCANPYVILEEDEGNLLSISFFDEPQSLPFIALAWIINLSQLHQHPKDRRFPYPVLSSLEHLGDSAHHYTISTNNENCYLFFTLQGNPHVFLRAPDGNDYIFGYSKTCPEGELTLSSPNIISEGNYLSPKQFFAHLPLQNNLYPLLDKWAGQVLK